MLYFRPKWTTCAFNFRLQSPLSEATILGTKQRGRLQEKSTNKPKAGRLINYKKNNALSAKIRQTETKSDFFHMQQFSEKVQQSVMISGQCVSQC